MPYDNETGLFYQSQGTKIDGTPDGDTVKEGFVQRTAPSVQDVYADMNLLRKIGSIGMPDGVSIVANENDMLSVKAYDMTGANNMPFSVGGAKTGLAKIDLSNVSNTVFNNKVTASGKATIIKTWANADKSGWYRKWSDGFIEQKGCIYNNANVGTTINFHIPFTKQSSITVLINHGVSGYFLDAPSGKYTDEPYDFTLTNFKIYTFNKPGLNYVQYYASGY